MIAVTPSGSLTTDVQTSLQALDTGKAPLSHTQLSSTISDSTAAGRALLTAADATAQNNLLGTTSLGFQSGNIKETAGLILETGWYYCDGSNKNRVTDVNLFNAITIQQTGTTTAGSPVITGLSDTTNGGGTPMSPGMPLSGSGIPVAAVILSVDSATQVTLSANATISATTPLVFAPYGVGDGTSTFGLPNRAYLAVGRDNASGTASNVMQVSTTATLISGNSNITVASAAGLAIGMFMSHPKLPSGTKINTISGTTIGCSNVASGSVSGSTVRFSPLLDAQTLGATGGALNSSLVTANLPPYTPAGSITNGAITTTTTYDGSAPGSTNTSAPQGGPTYLVLSGVIPITSTQAASTFAGAAQGGASAAFGNVQPTIVMNYIIKR
jgi:microcystin-dependent protein